MHLVRANFLGTQVRRRPTKVTSEAGDILDVRALRVWGQIPHLPVLEHALPKWSHRRLLYTSAWPIQGGKCFANTEFILGIEPRQREVRPWFDLECDGADRAHDICRGERGPVLADDTLSPEERHKGAARHGHVTGWASRASRSAAILDLDGDGDLDIVTNNYGDVPQVFISDLAQRGPVHFLKVRLVGQRSNHDGIGAVVTVKAGGRTQLQVNDGPISPRA